MNVSFEAGMAVLEALAGSKHPKTIDQIRSQTRFDQEIVQETLRILETTRYISISQASEIITLSPKLWSLGFCSKATADLTRVADHHLSELVMSTGESACMAIIADTEIVVAAGFNVPGPMGAEFEVGTKVPALACAAGKAILAFQSLEVIGELEQSALAAAPTQGDPHAFRREFEDIRSQGYAAHWTGGDSARCEMAAPIRCADGAIHAAVGISGSSSRLTDEVIPAMAEHILEAADRISRELQCLRAATTYKG